MTGEENLAEVWRQIEEIRAERAPMILACPYCHGRMVPQEDEICCPTMGRALVVLLDAADQAEAIEKAERIRDGAYAQKFWEQGTKTS